MFQLILLNMIASKTSWSLPSELDDLTTCCTRGPHAADRSRGFPAKLLFVNSQGRVV